MKLKTRFLGGLVLLLLTRSVGAQGLTAEQRAGIVGKLDEVLHKNAYIPGEATDQLDKTLADAKQKALDAKTDAEFIATINRSLRSMGFSHITLASPEATKRRATGRTIGIGAEIRPGDRAGVVTYVYPGSSAEKIGLRIGDRITKVDGEEYRSGRSLNGAVGSTVSLVFVSKDGEHARRLVREEYASRKPAEYRMLDADTAYIRIYSFQRYSNEEVRKAFTQVKEAKRLIVDLRSNGGGAVNSMMNFLSYFIPGGTTIGATSRRGDDGKLVDRPMKIGRENPLRFKGQIAVLTDRGSASASEITAAALQEMRGAIVIGRQSLGAVLTSTYRDVGEGYSLQFPISDYKTQKGVRLEKNGVKPQVELSVDDTRPALPGQPDKAINAAVNSLSAASSP